MVASIVSASFNLTGSRAVSWMQAHPGEKATLKRGREIGVGSSFKASVNAKAVVVAASSASRSTVTARRGKARRFYVLPPRRKWFNIA